MPLVAAPTVHGSSTTKTSSTVFNSESHARTQGGGVGNLDPNYPILEIIVGERQCGAQYALSVKIVPAFILQVIPAHRCIRDASQRETVDLVSCSY